MSCWLIDREARVGSHGMKLDEGLRKSTECLASISLDSSVALMSRASSQPNLLALDPDTPISSNLAGSRRAKSPSRRRLGKTSVDGAHTEKDTVMSTIPKPVELSSGTRVKSPSRSHTTISGVRADRAAKEDGGSRERVKSDDTSSTNELAVIDRTLAKVMSGLKTLDEIESPENTGSATKSSKDEEGQKSTSTISETVPIVVKTLPTRDDQQDEGSSSCSSFRGKKKAATLPKSGTADAVTAEVTAHSEMKHAGGSLDFDTLVEDWPPSPRSSLSRSDSAPQRKDTTVASRFEASSRAIPATTPVVPTDVPTTPSSVPTIPSSVPTIPSSVPTVPSSVPTIPSSVPTTPSSVPTVPSAMPTVQTGAPAVPPKPLTAKKPTIQGSPKTSRPSTDGKTTGLGAKLGKK